MPQPGTPGTQIIPKPFRSLIARMLPSLLLIAGGFFLAWWLLLYLKQDALMFPADFAPRPPRPVLSPPNRLLLRPIPNGQVEAWFLPAPSSPQPPSSSTAEPLPPAPTTPLVLFFHGNAEIIDQQSDIVRGYHALGCSVLLVEYRGYSRSAGRPSQIAIREDTLYFLDQVLQFPEVDPNRLIYHGRSLGGAVAADLASCRPPAALILESTFTSTAAMARRYLAPPFLIRNPFRTDRVVASYKGPLLILHGTTDNIVPLTHAYRLRALAPHARLVELQAYHNYLPPDQEKIYWQAIRSFLQEASLIPPPPPPANASTSSPLSPDAPSK